MLKITLQKLGNYFAKYAEKNINEIVKKSINEIVDNYSLIRDHKRIADNFNEFFANVGKNISSKNTCI